MHFGPLICYIIPDVLVLNIAQRQADTFKTLLHVNQNHSRQRQKSETKQNLMRRSARVKTWNTDSGSVLAWFLPPPVKTIFVQYLQNILCLQHMLPFAQRTVHVNISLRGANPACECDFLCRAWMQECVDIFHDRLVDEDGS